MKSFRIIFLMALCATLCGCPSNQQTQAAQAVDNAAIALQAAQSVESAAHKQGLISNQDDLFINTQFRSLSVIGITADSCTRTATSPGAAITCLASAINGVDQINSQGGLSLKSATAQADFQMGISAVRTVLAAIETAIGGTPPPAPISAAAAGVN